MKHITKDSVATALARVKDKKQDLDPAPAFIKALEDLGTDPEEIAEVKRTIKKHSLG